MKILYIAAVDCNDSKAFGVMRKILGQVKAVNNLGNNCDLISIDSKKIIKNKKVISNELVKPYYMNFHKFLDKNYSKYVEGYDFVYIRYFNNDYYMLELIKKIKSNNKKVVLEIPTYPLDHVESNLAKKVLYGIINNIVRKSLKKYVDYISVTNDYEEIFGIPTIKINNGIDLDTLKMINNEGHNKEEIHLAAVANLAKWHGYDRVIEGLAKYKEHNKSDKKIVFHIIGEGNEKEHLMKLTSKLKLEENIIFEGPKNGKELDDLFDICDIGVSSLALFRAGGGHDPIKSKEYIGRGLPVLLGYDDRVIDMSLSYVIKVSEDESAIDLNDIVEQYDNIKVSPSEIREYAEANLTWESQMKKVSNRLKN